MLGVLFSIVSAAGFSLNMVAVRRGVLLASVGQGMYITILGGVPLFAISALVTRQFFDISLVTGWEWLFLAAAGVVHFNIGRYANYQTVKAVGANGAAPFRPLAPLFAVAMAVLFLGESITTLRGIGIVFVILAPMVMIQRSKEVGNTQGLETKAAKSPTDSGLAVSQASPLTYNYRLGFFWGTVSSLAYGTSPLFVKAGLQETGLSLLGGLISYIAAALVLIIALGIPGRLTFVMGIPRGAIKYFVYGGLLVFFAQMFRYVALAMSPVTVIEPLQQTAAIWTVIFSWIFNRQTELFGPRVMGAIALSLAGALALVWPQ